MKNGGKNQELYIDRNGENTTKIGVFRKRAAKICRGEKNSNI